MSRYVLITGAAGFIGTPLRRRLAADGYLPVSVDVRPIAGELQPGELAFRVDLRDTRALERFWDELRESGVAGALAGVIHLAQYYDFSNRDHPDYEALLKGVVVLLRLVARDVPPKSPVIIAQSIAQLAPSADYGLKLTPESPRAADWEYAASKVGLEGVVRRAFLPQPVVQLALGGVYSEWCELVPLFMTIERVRRLSPEAFFFPGDPGHGLSYVHVDDAVNAFARALATFGGRPGQGLPTTLLVGEPAFLSYAEIHRRASLAFFGRPLPLLRIPRALAFVLAFIVAMLSRLLRIPHFIQPWMIAFADEHFELDVSRTERVLGLTPAHDIHRDLDLMLAHARGSRKEWLRRNRARPWRYRRALPIAREHRLPLSGSSARIK